jgi:hypothetical protein
MTGPAFSGSFKTKYATVTYSNDRLLERFNDNLVISRQLNILVRRRQSVTLKDEVKNKIDLIVEKAEAILEMFPPKVEFELVLLEDENDVKRYSKSARLAHKKLVGFFDPKTSKIYISVNGVDLKAFSHEIGHLIIEHHFEISPPVVTREMMAQFVASRIAN